MKIEKLKLTQIKPYWRNPRVNDSGIDSLKESIIKFGMKVPIVVDSKNVIITGHTRYKALIQIEGTLTKEQCKNKELEDINKGIIPVVIAKDLTEKEAKEFRITDNKISEMSSWDIDMLKLEVKELGDIIGYEDVDIDSLLTEDNTFNFKENTQEEIDAKSESLDNKFSDIDKDRKDGKVEVCCPYCSETFEVNKKDLI